MKIIICAGGTGGHIYPALSVAKEINLKKPSSKILFIGAGKKIEERIFSQSGFEYKSILSKGISKKFSFDLILSIVLLFVGFFQSLKIFIPFKPDVLLSMGGYYSVPVVFCAWLLKVPVVLHEQNVLPGRATKMLAGFADKIALSFEESRKYLKTKNKIFVTGNPVRSEVFNAEKQKILSTLGLDPNKKVVLIVGGSQGSISINKTIVNMIPLLEKEKLTVVHISGERDYEWVKQQVHNSCLAGRQANLKTQNYISKFKSSKLREIKFELQNIEYILINYVDNMAEVLSAADVIVSRAGATILSEISCLGIPAILIPYPYAAENHQQFNAEIFEEKGGAKILEDKNLSAEVLFAEIMRIIYDDKLRNAMALNCAKLCRKDASKKVAELFL